MANFTDRLTDSQSMGFINQIGDVFKNLPHLPPAVVDILVKIAPWLALLGGVLGLISGPVLGLLGGLATIFTLNPLVMVVTLGTAIAVIAQSVLLLMAFGPLKERHTKGWVLLFWSDMLSVVVAVLGVLDGNVGGIIGSVIGIFIGLYILFEMRSSYHGAASKK
jgi:hypothetical protein